MRPGLTPARAVPEPPLSHTAPLGGPDAALVNPTLFVVKDRPSFISDSPQDVKMSEAFSARGTFCVWFYICLVLRCLTLCGASACIHAKSRAPILPQECPNGVHDACSFIDTLRCAVQHNFSGGQRRLCLGLTPMAI